MPKEKHGGRQKGTPNKKTQELHEMCEKMGLNVFEGMIQIAIEDKDPDTRFDKLERIAPYLYPKRKSLDISSEDEKGFQIVIKDYTRKDE